ncbi:hypothetical protein DENSPDRAFT_855434 [Dentipellis sp. KUC8613]|nr:hypothetical protein DENSPDRAFT_855434 [Dentipellis sp. KUC8613]
MLHNSAVVILTFVKVTALLHNAILQMCSALRCTYHMFVLYVSKRYHRMENSEILGPSAYQGQAVLPYWQDYDYEEAWITDPWITLQVYLIHSGQTHRIVAMRTASWATVFMFVLRHAGIRAGQYRFLFAGETITANGSLEDAGVRSGQLVLVMSEILFAGKPYNALPLHPEVGQVSVILKMYTPEYHEECYLYLLSKTWEKIAEQFAITVRFDSNALVFYHLKRPVVLLATLAEYEVKHGDCIVVFLAATETGNRCQPQFRGDPPSTQLYKRLDASHVRKLQLRNKALYKERCGNEFHDYLLLLLKDYIRNPNSWAFLSERWASVSPELLRIIF